MKYFGRLAEAYRAVKELLSRSMLFWNASDDRQIYLEISSSTQITTLRELLILFQLAGYRVALRGQAKRWLLSVAHILEWHDNTRIIWFPPAHSKPVVWVTDQRRRTDGAEKCILLKYDYSPNLRIGRYDYVMPIPMHPQLYVQYNAQEKLGKYRRNTRRIRLLFAGNSNRTGYDAQILHELFGKLTRYEILQYLQHRGLARLVSEENELEEVLSSDYANAFILLSPPFRVTMDRWMELLSQADFFLCPPGVLLPWSHNSVEAMAVGTIPLISYPEWFFPALVNWENCVTFSTLGDLEQNLKTILTASDSQIAEMRRATISFYDEFLQPESFVLRLVESANAATVLHLCDEREEVVRQAMRG